MEPVSPVTSALLHQAAERIRGYARKTVDGVVSIGKELMMVRSVLGEEESFLEWLHENFGWSQRTAYKFIDAAKAFAQCATAGIEVELDALMLLPRLPKVERERVIEHAKASGERDLTKHKVRDWLELGRGPDDDVDQNERSPTADIVGKLREISIMADDPQEVAGRVEVSLRPFLADRARQLSMWLSRLASALEVVHEPDC